jgi:GntR family transcriptional regulator
MVRKNEDNLGLADLDPEGGAAYRALADLLRRSIADEVFKDGRQLPTEAELVDRFGLSRNTVRRALQELVAEGVVERTPGKGTFPTPPAEGNGYIHSVGTVEDLIGLFAGSTWLTLEPLHLETDIEAASRLRSETDQVYSGVFMRRQEDESFSVSRLALPQRVGRALVDRGELVTADEVSDRTIIKRVDAVNPDPVTVIHQSITACEMPAHYAELLDAEPGSPAIRIDRLYVDAAERAVELAVSFFNPNRYTYRIELHRKGAAPASHAESGQRVRKPPLTLKDSPTT